MRKNILVIRSSDFQFYAANKLFSKNFIDLCIIENGSSIKTELSINYKNIIKLLKTMLSLKNFMFRIYYFLMFKKFYGNRAFHNKSKLKKKNIELNKKKKKKYFDNINDKECVKFINLFNPQYLITFGTGIVDVKQFKNVKTINIHWGISPIYKGEGIVSSISRNDFKNLGVTIHKLNEKIDDGEIISQSNIQIDKLDNFYSLGLKMAITGTKLIVNYFEKRNTKVLSIDNKTSKVYDSKYFQRNYKDFYLAFKNLKKQKSLL